MVYAEGILHKVSRKYTCTFDKYNIHKNQVRWSPVGGLCTCATARLEQRASNLDDLYAVSEVLPITFDDTSTAFVVLVVPESKVVDRRTDRQTDIEGI